MTETFTPIIIYLLHFEQPIGHARHYMGSCEASRLEQRMLEHRKGKGASLTREAAKRGIAWTISASFRTEDRRLERRLKRHGHFKRHCMVCRQAAGDRDLFTQSPCFAHVVPHQRFALSW